MLITDTAIRGLKLDGKTDHIFFDDALPGFGYRIRTDGNGSTSYVYQYTLNGKQRRLTIKAPSARDARKRAQKLALLVADGQDPQATKEAVEGEAFVKHLGPYLASPGHKGRRRGAKSLVEVRRHLERNLSPLHKAPIRSIDRQRVSAELRRITKDNGPVEANRTGESLSAFLAWCVREGILDTNPAKDMNRNEEASRDRVLSDSELGMVWKALPAAGDDFGDAMRLLILTGCRKSEVNLLHWREVDIGKATLAISAARSKNRRAHLVPLSPPALAVLQARPQQGRAMVFGYGQTGFGNWDPAKKELDRVLRLNEGWVIHDLRRTVATGLQKLKFPQEVTEAVLNHKSGKVSGIAAIYSRHDFADEKREALNLWGQHVMSLI